MGAPPVRPAIISHFQERPNTVVTLENLAKATKLRPDQVRVGINNIRSSHNKKEMDFPIEVIQRGQIWRYVPGKDVSADIRFNAAPETESPAKHRMTEAKPTFELIGKAKDGSAIIQSDNGQLYRATEL